MLHCTLALDISVLIRSFLVFLVGVSGIMLTLVGENGSCKSISGLVALPSNEVGRVVRVSAEEYDESERVERSEEERCMSQAPCLYSVATTLVWAIGVRGSCESRKADSLSRSLGDGSAVLWVYDGLLKLQKASTDGSGMSASEPNLVCAD